MNAVAHYFRPTSLDEALGLKAEHPAARYIAGGTDLMVKMRAGVLRAPVLISLRNIAELHGVEAAGDVLRIGALTPIAQVAAHPAVLGGFPIVAQAARTLGSAQIRNAASIGGNLCNASPCADTAPPLLVLEAQLEIRGGEGTRQVAMDEFIVAPGETRLGPDEVVTAILLPRTPADQPPARTTFIKKGRVRMDLSLLSMALLMQVEGDRCLRARAAAGAAAPRPLRLRAVEQMLEGQTVDEPLLERLGTAASEEVQPIDDLRTTAAYRRQLAGVFIKRAVRQLIAGGVA